jgi:MscS family membrane protein
MIAWIELLEKREIWREIFQTLLVIFAAWGTAQIYLILIEKVLRPWANKTSSDLDDEIVDAIRRPGFLFILLVGGYVALHRYKFGMLPFLDGVLFVFGVMLIIFTLTKIAVIFLSWYGKRIAGEKEGEAVARELLPLADKSLKLILLIVGLVIVLDHFAIDIKSILVTLGVGSLAIGLALQDTLANMFGGFTIMLDRSFRINDRIQLQSGESGDVQSIGLRSTTVLTPDGHTLIIPNSILVKTIVINQSHPDSRARIIIEVGISQSSDCEAAKKIMSDAAAACPLLRANPSPAVLFSSFGPSVLNLRLICFADSFLNTGLAGDFLHTRIYSGFRSAGIEIPHPVRNIYIASKVGMPV